MGSRSLAGLVLWAGFGLLAGCGEHAGDDDDDDLIVPDECDEGQLWDDTLATCVPEHCGADRYPAAPAEADHRVHVDPTHTDTALGEPDYPFQRLDQALAAAGEGAVILLAAGDYSLSYAHDIYQPGLQLLGRCPELSRLVVEGPHRGLRVGQTSDVTLSGFTVAGSGEIAEDEPLVECFNSTGVTLTDLVLEDSADAGLLSWQCADVQVEEVTVERAVGRGIHVGLNSGITLDSCQVSDTRAGDGEGASIQVEHGTDAWVEACSVDGGEVPGVLLSDIDGLTARGNLVDDPAGPGLQVIFSEGVEIADNELIGARGFGIRLQASEGDVTGNRVTHTTPDDAGEHGVGLSVEDGMAVAVEANQLTGNAEIGLAFVRSSGSLSGNTVEGTVPGSWGQGGRGMELVDISGVIVRDNQLTDNVEAGIVVMDATATLEDNRIAGTLAGPGAVDGYPAGHGIHVQTSTNVICLGNLVEGAQHAGISYLWVLGGEITGNTVRSTGIGDGGAWGFGDGIQVVGADGDVRVEDNTLESHDRCGLLVDQSRVWASGNGIGDNEYAVVSQNASLLLEDDNEAAGNQIDETVTYDDRVLQVHDGGWTQLSDDLEPPPDLTKSTPPP